MNNFRVPFNPKSQSIAEQERKKKLARLNTSAIYKLSSADLVEPANMHEISINQKRNLGDSGGVSLFSTRISSRCSIVSGNPAIRQQS